MKSYRPISKIFYERTQNLVVAISWRKIKIPNVFVKKGMHSCEDSSYSIEFKNSDFNVLLCS